MWIEEGPLHARVRKAEPAERAWLRDYLSIPDSKARFRGGDGVHRLYNELAESFPSGYAAMVAKAAREEGFRVDVIDKRERPAERDPAADLAWLRERVSPTGKASDYQLQCLERLLAKERGIAALPTAAGKTEIAIGAVRAVPCEWLFLTPGKDLTVQAADRFERRNAEHSVDLGPAGRIVEGRWEEGPRFTSATFQSMASALKRRDPRALALLGRVGGVMVDESHTLPADSFWGVAMACPAYYRFGFSGTPLARGDRRSILSIAALGPVVFRMRPEELIELGFLSRPRIRMKTVRQVAVLPFDEAYERLVVRSKVRNAAVVELAKRCAKPAFVFVEREAHGKILERALINAGVKASFVWGTHSLEWRRSHVRRVVSGHLDVVVCTRIFLTGLDVPELAGIVNAAGRKSVIETLQRLGRGMRLADGKDEFELHDVLDVGNEYLAQHARVRRNTYAAQGYETVVEP
jgi:superfamily II DNA or RNA helicase